ncbi:hypothetical protein [Plantactinospora sp. DSM 117369]
MVVVVGMGVDSSVWAKLSDAAEMVRGVAETVRYSYRLRPGATVEAALLAGWGGVAGCGTRLSTNRH